MTDNALSAELSIAEIRRKVDALGPWFHNLDLHGVHTAPSHYLGDYPTIKWRNFSGVIDKDLRGKTVLDIGCNAGFYAMEMKRRGADRVLGLDSDDEYIAQARFAAEINNLSIEFRKMSIYDIGQLGEKFDIVIFMGVLYHLRHPLLALDLIHEHVARDLMLFQSMQRGPTAMEAVAPDYDFWTTDIFEQPGFPRMQFIEHRYANDPTNWWIPNRACVEAMLRSAGFAITAHPEDEVYLCRCADRPQQDGSVYPAKGLRA